MSPSRRLDTDGLRAIEPHAAGIAALHVADAGLVDFARVSAALVTDLDVRLRHEVAAHADVPAQVIVNCAGLHADRVATLLGVDLGGLRIIPFRGEYHDLRPAARGLVRGLLYPVPDPAFPFLGVHLTRGLDGSVHAGPNAVLALTREGYRWADIDRTEVARAAGRPGLRRLARRHWRDRCHRGRPVALAPPVPCAPPAGWYRRCVPAILCRRQRRAGASGHGRRDAPRRLRDPHVGRCAARPQRTVARRHGVARHRPAARWSGAQAASRSLRPICRTASPTRPARTCASTPTTRSTGTRGATRRSPRPGDEDKPILLSVGYSACHWCHVMAHESLRGRRDRGGDERAVRQREGRPRGAARRRRHLHGGGAGA